MRCIKEKSCCFCLINRDKEASWLFFTLISSTGTSKLGRNRPKKGLQTDRFPEALAGGGRARGAERAPPSAVDSASPLLRADQAEKLPLQLIRRRRRRRRRRCQAHHAPVVADQQRGAQRGHVAPRQLRVAAEGEPGAEAGAGAAADATQ